MFLRDDLEGVIRIEANIKKKPYLWYLRPIYIQSSPKGSFILTHVKSKAIIPFSRSLSPSVNSTAETITTLSTVDIAFVFLSAVYIPLVLSKLCRR